MVKNTGGNKTKKGARKVFATPNTNKQLRLADEDGECYAIVKKLYGNGMCEVICQDNKSRLCIIRNKFKRSKSLNLIDVGKWVLVGIRDWEVRSDGTQKCDLLDIYDDKDKQKLMDSNINLLALINVMKDIGNKTNIDYTGFELMNESEQAYEEIITSNSDKLKVIIADTEINIDDI